MMENNILKKYIKIVKIFVCIIIIILSIIILYTKYHTPEMDIQLRDFISNFNKVSLDDSELKTSN